MLSRLFYLLVMIAFSGCSSMQLTEFEKNTPKFDFDQFFSGSTLGQGVFYDRFGRIKSRFQVELIGEKNEHGIKLFETLTDLDSSKVTKRTFDITRTTDRTFQVACSDLVGTGKINVSGNAARWNYVLRQPVGDDFYNLTFDDWMFRLDENTVLNRAYAYWYGFFVGEVIMTVKKLS